MYPAPALVALSTIEFGTLESCSPSSSEHFPPIARGGRAWLPKRIGLFGLAFRHGNHLPKILLRQPQHQLLVAQWKMTHWTIAPGPVNHASLVSPPKDAGYPRHAFKNLGPDTLRAGWWVTAEPKLWEAFEFIGDGLGLATNPACLVYCALLTC